MAVARRYYPKVQLDDGYLWDKLMASEADIARRLRTWLQPRMMLPIWATPEEVATYTGADPAIPVYLEPGYDYTPDLYNGPSWGFIEVRWRPIISIASISFTYPTPSETLYTFPNDWIRPDLKYGTINLVPSQTAVQGITLNAFVLSAFSGGATVPLTLQIRYKAGLQNVWDDYPDIIDLIYKATSLSILEEQYIPQSGSVSTDGLSQSLSFNMEDYQDMIETRVTRLKRSIHGIQMLAL